MAKKFNKEELFKNYFNVTKHMLKEFERIFQIDGVVSEVLGISDDQFWELNENPKLIEISKDRIRASTAWQALSELYDYAVDGIICNDNTTHGIVIDGAEVISYITTENCKPTALWDEIIYLGDGRHALDEGYDLLLIKLALLANVDVKTVRNAISAQEVISYKNEDGIFIENASAQKWLSGRRGFQPTQKFDEIQHELQNIKRPSDLGTFLAERRKVIALNTDHQQLTHLHPLLSLDAILEIEAGVFKLPLDTVFPIADYYQIERKEFLSCVMRVFFEEQYLSLRELIAAQ